MAPAAILVIAIPPLDWLRRSLGSFAYVRDSVQVPQINAFREVDEHVNMLSRRAMHRLLAAADLRPMKIRYHHSRVFNNVLARAMRIDDGYYFAQLARGRATRLGVGRRKQIARSEF
jgi:hypothetical protein